MPLVLVVLVEIPITASHAQAPTSLHSLHSLVPKLAPLVIIQTQLEMSVRFVQLDVQLVQMSLLAVHASALIT